jgi:hypothetical protein
MLSDLEALAERARQRLAELEALSLVRTTWTEDGRFVIIDLLDLTTRH